MNVVKTITSKKGKEVTFRYPEAADAEKMCEYINALSQERTFIRIQGAQISLEDEKKFLEGKLKAIEAKQSIFLVAFHKDTLVGVTQIDSGAYTDSHIGTFGISLHKDYREEGIGRAFMSTVIEEAIRNLPGLEIIVLGIHAANARAMNLYTSFGFVPYGRLPNGVKKEHNAYDDHIWMYKEVK
jgi:RimJ/RimL family protein N-acetyltransferase